MFLPKQEGGFRAGIRDDLDALRFFLAFLRIIFKFSSLSVEVFLRHSLGERYLNFFIIVMAWLCTSTFNTLAQLVAVLNRSFSVFMLLFTVVSVVVMLAHRVHIWWRNRKGARLYSYYSGTPWLLLVIDRICVRKGWKLRLHPATVKTYLEPLLVLFLSVLFGKFDRIFGLYLFWASFSLMMQALIENYHERSEFLNIMDSQIRADNLQKAFVDQARPEYTQGFTVAPLGGLDRATRQSLADAMQRMEPALQQMLTPSLPATAPFLPPPVPTSMT